jgi:hypothetical protein
MSTIINATTTNGVVIQPDNSGSLVLQTNSGTTALTIDTSQRAAFVAGTAAAPAITTTGDTNTGIWFPAADTIAFAEGGAESMRIDSSGNVGVGVTPNAGWASTAKAIQFGNPSVNSVTSSIATIAGNVNLTNDAYYDGTNWKYLDSYFATRYLSGDGVHTWSTAASGTAGNTITWSESMRIDSSGNVLIGRAGGLSSGKVQTYAPNSIYTHQIYQDYSSGTGNFIEFIRTTGTFGSVAGVVGTITASTTTTTYATSSDYRLKENIVPMTGALDVVSALKPVTYNWKVDGLKGQGFIAHELQAVVPDCVTGEKDAVETYTDEEGNEQTRIKPQGIDTSFLVATLTAAIQEQQTIINDLKARVETLEAK